MQDSRTQAQIDFDDQILIDRALARQAKRDADTTAARLFMYQLSQNN